MKTILRGAKSPKTEKNVRGSLLALEEEFEKSGRKGYDPEDPPPGMFSDNEDVEPWRLQLEKDMRR